MEDGCFPFEGLQICCFYEVRDRIDCQFHASSPAQWEAKILSPAQGNVYKWCKGTGFLYNDTLQRVTIMLWATAGEMPVYFNWPYSYAIDDVGAKSVVKKRIRQGKDACDYNVGRIGSQHKMTTICDTELKNC
jgi:hypothetical protein